MRHDLLKEHFLRYEVLSSEELSIIGDFYEEQTVPKGDFILRAGEVFRYEGFVLEGCFKVFTTNAKGEEKILYFAIKDWWVMEIDSFMNQTASQLNIQSLQDSRLLTISRSKKQELYTKVPKMERIFRLMSQKAVASWQKRLIRNHTMTAEERYDYFLKSYPEIAMLLTNKQIASYLGITQEFVSVIRKRRMINKV